MDIQPLTDGGAEQVVARTLDEIREIATLPEVTLKIIETVEDPRSTARDLHEIVTHDLALSARILRVANSAFYGLPGQIASIDRAIVMLGLNAVKNIAIAASLSKLFRGGRISRAWTARDLWIHSLAVGAASKMIVETLRMALPDEAFVGGLIHDIGLVVMLQSHMPKLQELMRLVEQAERQAGDDEAAQAAPADAFRAAEHTLFAATHESFGAALARKWKFPRSFQYVTGHHHHPEMLARDNRLLTQVVYLAETLCCKLNIGMALPIDAHPMDRGIADELGLGARDVDRLCEQLPGQVEMAMQLFN